MTYYYNYVLHICTYYIIYMSFIYIYIYIYIYKYINTHEKIYIKNNLYRYI